MTAPLEPMAGSPGGLVTDPAVGTPAEAPRGTPFRGAQVLLAVTGAVFVLSVVRVVADSPGLTSSGTFSASLRLAVPIGLAGLGALYAERAGVVNIGLEGMMILGTWFGAWAGFEFGPWWGVLAGILGGAAGGLVHAVATVSFGVDHIISGVAINILGAGVARFLSVIAYEGVPGGGATQSPRVQGGVGTVDLPFVSGGSLFGWRTPDLFGWMDRQDWFFVTDLGGLLKGLTSNVSWLAVIAVGLVPVSYWLLWRTPTGLRLRSVGENPAAAESLGVAVYRMKYLGVVVSGALAGLAGAFLVLVSASVYREGQTGGRGFIGLAALIFGNWRPTGVALGSGLFGFADALQLRSREAVHGLLLFISIVALLFALRAFFLRRAPVQGGVLAAVAVGFGSWYLASDSVPTQFVFFTPHVTTLLVLSLAAQRLRPPAADGQPYRKGQVA